MLKNSDNKKFPALRLLALFLAVSGLTAFVLNPSKFSGGGDVARLATCQALVEEGTFCIDNSAGIKTIDKVYIEGKFYGCQTPLMPVCMAIVYWPLHLLGLNFTTHYRFLAWLLTLIFSGGSAAGAALIVGKISLSVSTEMKKAVRNTLLFFFATLFFAYSTILNNHVSAGFLLLLAYYLIVFREQNRNWHFLLAGIAAASAAVTDPPAGIALGLALSAYLLCNKISLPHFLLFVLGGIIPGIVHSFASLSIHNSVFPVNIVPEYFDYPGAWFDEHNLSGVVANTTIPEFAVYTFHSLLGHRGLFLYTPLLLFALWGHIKMIRSPQWRMKSLTALIPAIVVIVFYLWRTQNYGGTCYGNRFFLSITPLLFMGIVILPSRINSKLVKTLFIIAVIISIVFASVGALNPASDEFLGLNSFAANLFHYQSLYFPALSTHSWKILAWLYQDDPNILTFLGEWFFYSQQFSAGEKVLKKSLSQEENAETYYWLGETAYTSDRLDTAVVYLEKALEFASLPRIYSALGYAYSRLDRYEEGNRYIEKYLRLADSLESIAPAVLAKNHLLTYPANGREQALAFLANNYLDLQDTARAAEILAQIDLSPYSFYELSAANLKMMVLRGDTSSAQSLLEKVIASRPAFLEPLKKEKILTEFIASIEKNPGN